MGNQPTTGGSGPVTLSPISSASTSTTSGDGLSTQLIIWGMVGFILVEAIGILCLLRYCCNARSRRKKANELGIKSIKNLSKSRENLKTNLSNLDSIDHGQLSINELPLQTSAEGTKKRPNQVSNEFESLYAIDETKFSGTASFTGSMRDGRLRTNEPIETLEMLIDSGNKRISRKLASADSGQDDDVDEELIYKLSQRSNDDEITYEYTGVLNPPYLSSYVNHAEVRPATPVRFEETRELKRRGDSNTNSVNRNIRFADDSDSLRFSSRRPRSYTRYDDDYDNERMHRKKGLSYEIHHGEPVQWQVAKDLITPDWDSLKADADDKRGYRHANIIEPNESTRSRYTHEERRITHETFRGGKKDEIKNPSQRSGRQSPISFISNHNENTSVGHEAKSANKGLYSQLPFGSMKRFSGFQNAPQPPPPLIPINTESNAYKLVEEEKHTIKKILKDPDTDEILSVKSFIDFTNTVDVVPESELIRKSKNEDRFSMRTVSASTTSTTNRNLFDQRQASAVSNKTGSNISIIDVKPKTYSETRDLSEFERKSLSNQNSDSSIISGRFPSPPEFGDDNIELKQNGNNSRSRTPTGRNSLTTFINNDVKTTLHEELHKSKDFSEITFKDKSLEYFSTNDIKTDNVVESATSKQRSTNVSVKSSASSSVNKKSGMTLPFGDILSEIRSFKPDTLKHTPEKSDMRVEYNLTPRSNSSSKKTDLDPPFRISTPPPTSPYPPPPPPPPIVPPLGFDQQNSPRIITTLSLPTPSGLPDNPPTDRDWSAVMKSFDENISDLTSKSLNDSLANLQAEIEKQEDENIEAQLF